MSRSPYVVDPNAWVLKGEPGAALYYRVSWEKLDSGLLIDAALHERLMAEEVTRLLKKIEYLEKRVESVVQTLNEQALVREQQMMGRMEKALERMEAIAAEAESEITIG